MLDISGSMYGNLPLLRAACEQLFARLGPHDLARLGTFGADITVMPAFTADRAALLDALPAAIPREARKKGDVRTTRTPERLDASVHLRRTSRPSPARDCAN